MVCILASWGYMFLKEEEELIPQVEVRDKAMEGCLGFAISEQSEEPALESPLKCHPYQGKLSPSYGFGRSCM